MLLSRSKSKKSVSKSIPREMKASPVTRKGSSKPMPVRGSRTAKNKANRGMK